MKKRILWICNMAPPMVATELNLEKSNKEGWITGTLETLLEQHEFTRIELGIAIPTAKSKKREVAVIKLNEQVEISAFTFREDMAKPEIYDELLEEDFKNIIEDFQPDMIHCFGTEFPHTLAVTKVFNRPNRTLIGLQGICSICATGYMANIPARIREQKTFRDRVKKDKLSLQQRHFIERGENEKKAVQLAKHITGRTTFDRLYADKCKEEIKESYTYHFMNETLRQGFYKREWSFDACIEYRLLLSQGDYPIKGLHYAVLALKEVLNDYPKTKLCIAGNPIIRPKNLKGRLTISAYGLYIEQLIKELHLENNIEFLGKLNSEEMILEFEKTNAFICASTFENSPNSLGEAMLMGVPIVTSDVGGITSMINADECFMFEGFKANKDVEEELHIIANNMSDMIKLLFSRRDQMFLRAKKAKERARVTHDKQVNYERLLEIYEEVIKS